MKDQALFSSKDKLSSAAILFGTLKVKSALLDFLVLS